MKQVLFIIAVTATMLSCKSKTNNETKVLSATEMRDSIQFAQWKEAKARNTSTTHYNNTVANSAAAPAAAPARKKGWSKAAKGAVIGAGTGAVAGAIINKRNRGAGAVVGGVLGGGVGYGIGRSQDKKDGRN